MAHTTVIGKPSHDIEMIELLIDNQPDDETCGPTSLRAVYNYYQHPVSLTNIIQEVEQSHSGGTLASLLGKHALANGFETTIYINNLTIFDPSWFDNGYASRALLLQKIMAQMKYKRAKKLMQAMSSYTSYLELGGEIRFCTIDVKLLNAYFRQNIPIITGLSATYLYDCPREYWRNNRASYDDIRGTPCGHFVVLCGYDAHTKKVTIADPHRANPLSHDNYYQVSSDRLINAIMLGVLTYDATLLVIKPREV